MRAACHDTNMQTFEKWFCGWMRFGGVPRLRGRRIWLITVFLAVTTGMLQAQLGSRPAEEWIKTLESSHRVEQLKIEETVAKLNLQPGNRVVDIGAGSGLFCPPLAKAVSPGGHVYAVEIEEGLLEHIANRARELELGNVGTVLGQFTDPNLPVRDLDLALIFDVLHHIEHRAEYLRNLAGYLKPTGRIAVVDFHPERGPHRNDPTLQTTRVQTDAWMAAIGFKPVEMFDLFEDKWFVIYSRASKGGR
jgi:ubiquinone/menaquinone biosynthesis C-methylase UbiE